MHDWFPLALSVAGAVVSFGTMLCVAVIGWLVKYVMQNTERRLIQLEQKTEVHAGNLATAAATTVAEQQTLGELRDEIRELRAEVRAIIGQRPLIAPRGPVPHSP